MIYDFALNHVALAIGALLILIHFIPALRPAAALNWLEKIPRSRAWGIVLFGLAAVWACWLTATMDLGEVTNWRNMLVTIWAIAAILMIIFVPDFLAVHGLALLSLLLANVLLDAAFLHSSSWRFAVTILTYLFIIRGLLLFAMPHWMRDGIAWMKGHLRLYRALNWVAVLYGALLVGLAVAVY